MTDLAHLIDVVNVKLAKAGDGAGLDHDTWKVWYGQGERIVQELRDECGARIRTDREPATMMMGGIRTSATGGWCALLTNWIAAARRRSQS